MSFGNRYITTRAITSNEVNPFRNPPVANAHSHFVPTRSSGPVESMSHVSNNQQQPVIKPPKAPEKPLVPYMRFSRQVWHKVREENKDCAVHDVGRKIGTLWRELSDREKAIFQEQWEAEKVEYDKQMKAYHNSAAYQAYLATKSGQMPPPKMSVRRVAAMRYERNQRLMAELLSENWVGDARNVVTQQRMSMLKRQASSLATHQKNLETELVALEEKFGKKKKEMSDSSSAFSTKLAEVNAQRPSLDPQLYEDMVEKSSEKLLTAYKESLEPKETAEEEKSSPDPESTSKSPEEMPAPQIPVET